MLKSPLLDVVLPKVPQYLWNELSSIYTLFTSHSIGSPISFTYKNLRLEEYSIKEMPPLLLEKFLQFCYPADMPGRNEEIACDRKNYSERTATFLVFKEEDIVGCVQIVPKTPTQHLPVEYAEIINTDETRSGIDIFRLTRTDNVTEIYRCRRSFDLRKIEAINVLLMLYKAVWAKVIQLGTAYTLISFDSDSSALRSLYCSKLDFDDPDITLTFRGCDKKWSLLLKDWYRHEHHFANISKPHFYLQTWFRSSLKKRHFRRGKPVKGIRHEAVTCNSSDFLIAQTFTSDKKDGFIRSRRHRST